MKIHKRFYVGSRSLTCDNDWAHSTLKQAICHDKRLVYETDEEQIVVQIIRKVSRQSTPIIVEKV